METNKKKLFNELKKPVIFVDSKSGILKVIYNNRTVMFKHLCTDSFKELSEEQGSKFTKEDEIQMSKGNNERQIKYLDRDNEEVWDEILGREE